MMCRSELSTAANLSRSFRDGDSRARCRDLRMSSHLALYRVDLATHGSTMIESGSTSETRAWIVDAKGTPLARKIYSERAGWALEFKRDGAWTVVKGLSDIVGSGPEIVGLGRDGNSVLLRVATGDAGQSESSL